MSEHRTSREPLELPTVEETRSWEARAVERLGIPERVLMESAGRAAARVLQELYPTGRVVAAVGRGKNGGDAVVLLRSLRSWGREVAAVPVGDVRIPAELTHGWDIPVLDAKRPGEWDAGVLIDGILGTGARGAPREEAAAAIRCLNASGRPIVALDGPSGVDLTTGRTAGDAVMASTTITFGAPKRGLVLFPGREHAGRIIAVEIGLPPAAADEVSAGLITPEWAFPLVPRLPRTAHKGGAGTLAIIAGHPGMGGAALLLAMGALRAGTGKVRLIAPEANRVAIQSVVPEALFVDRDGDGVGEVVATADAVAVGPGMGTDARASELLEIALGKAGGPILLDADALTLISKTPALLSVADPERCLITPHPGEMARLMNLETRDVVGEPFEVATRAAERFGCTVLLKGTPTIVAAPGRPALVNVAGHSGIATSGMGDTLAGIITALLGRGVGARHAAAVGVFLAGRAAELVGRDRPLLPRDVAEALPRAMQERGPFGTLRIPEVRLDLPAAT